MWIKIEIGVKSSKLLFSLGRFAMVLLVQWMELAKATSSNVEGLFVVTTILLNQCPCVNYIPQPFLKGNNKL